MKPLPACIPSMVIMVAVSASLAIAAEQVAVATEPLAESLAQAPEATDMETQSFIIADENTDLKLEYEEFRVFIGLLAEGDHRSAKWVRALRLYSTAFSVIDKNEDGFVDPVELAEGEAEHGK